MPTPRWDRPELTRRVLLALRLTEHAVRASTVAADTTDRDASRDRLPADLQTDIPALVRAKVVGAAALLLRSVATPADLDHRIAAAADALARLVSPLARDEDVRTAVCLEPGRALEHASAHVLLTDAGYPDVAFERLLEQSVPASPGVERRPTRELEQCWLAGIRDGTDPTVDDVLARSVLARSVLGRPLDALAASGEDHYSFTHTVLYASDIGRCPPRLPRPGAEISADADAALAAGLDADDAGLTAELLWTWPMLGLPWTPAATLALTVLTERFDAHGFLPGPAFRTAHLHRLPTELQEEYVLRSSHHTTLAMGMLCASALGRARRPPPGVCGREEATGVTDAVYLLLRHQARPWLTAFAALDRQQQNSLGDLLVAVALRRARRSADLASVRETLTVALRHGCVDAPAPRQAVGLLRRAALNAGATGHSAGATGIAV